MRMEGQSWTSFCPDQSVASDFGNVLDPQKSRMKVVLSVRVGVSGVLCHLDSSNDTTGHYDGYLMSEIYIWC